MADIVCLGTVSVDLYYKGGSLTHDDQRFELAVGGKYFTTSFFEGLGGGGANVAIGIEKNGLDAALIAKVGNNSFKKVIVEHLEDAKVTFHDYIDFVDEYQNISTVLLTEKGEKTIINYRSQHDKIFATKEEYRKLVRGKALYMANLSNVTLTERIEVLKYAKENGIKTYANLNVTDCRRPIEEIIHFLSQVDVLIINGYEFSDIVKTSYTSIDFETNIISKYAPFSSDKLVVITDGAKGSYAYFDGKIYRQKAIKPEKIVDTTGAGDGFTAAFIAENFKSQDIEKAMMKGATYAVEIMKRLGAN